MSQPLDIGSLLGGGRYVVEKVLGIGGFGITYYVRHKGLGSYCAIKEMFLDGRCVRAYDRKTVELQGLDNSFYDKLRKSFVAEARILTRLHNPHIVKVFDIFDENNTSYMVMEFVSGKTLQELIKQQGKIPFDDAINIMGQLSEAVAAIHKENVLHRDIKPDNIILTPENNVVLIDFGAAREFVQNQTQRHTVILTPGFAPIEQYNDTGRRGNYTDIYAMGGVFYYILTGIIPKVATERAMEAMASPKELNPAIPKTVSDTIMKAMAFKPEDRYQTVDAFMTDLIKREDDKTTGIGEPKEVGKKQMNAKWIALVIVGGLMVLGIVGAIGYSYYLNHYNLRHLQHKEIVLRQKLDFINEDCDKLGMHKADPAVEKAYNKSLAEKRKIEKQLNEVQKRIARLEGPKPPKKEEPEPVIKPKDPDEGGGSFQYQQEQSKAVSGAVTPYVEEFPAIEQPEQEIPAEQPKTIDNPKALYKGVEQPKQEIPAEQPQTIDNPKALYKGTTKPQTGTSAGITGQSGNQGKPNGLTGIKQYDGNVGKVNSTSYNLGGRGVKILYRPDDDFSEEGEIVVDIWVNRAGQVVRAEVATKGTVIVDYAMWQKAIQAAKRSTFAADPDAPEEQHGTITYTFVYQ